MNQIELIQILTQQWEYPPGQAPAVALKLHCLPDELQRSFADWLQSGILPETPVYSEFTPARLFQDYVLKPPACFLMLDWLRRNPNEALSALVHEIPRRKNVLSGGQE